MSIPENEINFKLKEFGRKLAESEAYLQTAVNNNTLQEIEKRMAHAHKTKFSQIREKLQKNFNPSTIDTSTI